MLKSSLFALTALTMIAFAANSLLNRAALAGGEIGPAGFALLRLFGGAAVLLCLLAFRSGRAPKPPRPAPVGVLGLLAYMLGFSFAYVALDAGVGALILFGGVQLTMFAGAQLMGQGASGRRWIGMLLSLIGLVILVWPSASGAFDARAIVLMCVAAFGWGVYSLHGAGQSDALRATAWNFTYALPLAALVVGWIARHETASLHGVFLALFSGGVTSGLGYALWYRILPKLGPTRAALSQLTVPVIALLAGVVFLSEPLSLRAVLACLLICGGIAFGLMRGKKA